MTESPDAYVLSLVSAHPNLLIPHFLIHSYLYYVCDWPIISDATFDTLVAQLQVKWESLEHPHKHLLDVSLLKTGYYLRYPRRTASAALSLAERFKPGCPQLYGSLLEEDA